MPRHLSRPLYPHLLRKGLHLHRRQRSLLNMFNSQASLRRPLKDLLTSNDQVLCPAGRWITHEVMSKASSPSMLTLARIRSGGRKVICSHRRYRVDRISLMRMKMTMKKNMRMILMRKRLISNVARTTRRLTHLGETAIRVPNKERLFNLRQDLVLVVRPHQLLGLPLAPISGLHVSMGSSTLLPQLTCQCIKILRPGPLLHDLSHNGHLDLKHVV